MAPCGWVGQDDGECILDAQIDLGSQSRFGSCPQQETSTLAPTETLESSQTSETAYTSASGGRSALIAILSCSILLLVCCCVVGVVRKRRLRYRHDSLCDVKQQKAYVSYAVENSLYDSDRSSGAVVKPTNAEAEFTANKNTEELIRDVHSEDRSYESLNPTAVPSNTVEISSRKLYIRTENTAPSAGDGAALNTQDGCNLSHTATTTQPTYPLRNKEDRFDHPDTYIAGDITSSEMARDVHVECSSNNSTLEAATDTLSSTDSPIGNTCGMDVRSKIALSVK